MEFDSSNIAALTSAMSELKGVVSDLSGVMAGNAKHAERGAEAAKKAAEETKKQGQLSRKFANDLKATAQHATGVQLSLGFILKMLVDVWNLGRKIQGLARMAAGPLGTSVKGINHARTAMRDLRSQFRMSYDEAGKMTSQMTRLGLKAKDLAGHAYVAKAFVPDKRAAAYLLEASKFDRRSVERLSKINAVIAKSRTRYDDNSEKWVEDDKAPAPPKAVAAQLDVYKSILDADKKASDVKAKIEVQLKKHVAIEEKSKRLSADSLKLETEWYALQTMKGIALQQSAGIYRTLRSEFSKTKDVADKMYGAAISSVEEINAGQNDIYIGAQEYVQTWQSMIEKVRVFKTDAMGILALQNTLLRKGGGMGLDDDAPQSVKLGIAQTIAGMPLNMDLGTKAFIGRGMGSNPMESALEFERLFESDDPKKIAEAVTRVLSSVSSRLVTPRNSGEAAQEIGRARGMFTKYGFDAEQTKLLADATVKGKMSGKGIDQDFAGKFSKELGKVRKNEDDWAKHRGELISSASKAAKGIQSMNELIKKWLQDKILGVLSSIDSSVGYIADMFGGSATRELSTGKADVKSIYGVNPSATSINAGVSGAMVGDPTGFLTGAAKTFGYNPDDARRSHFTRESALAAFGGGSKMAIPGNVNKAMLDDWNKLGSAKYLQVMGKAGQISLHNKDTSQFAQLKGYLRTGSTEGYKIALEVIRAELAKGKREDAMGKVGKSTANSTVALGT